MSLNNYDQLAESYKYSNTKPDKQWSILPTVLQICGDLRGKTVLDLGCGNGFFSHEFARSGASAVIGLDNSQVQIFAAQSGAGPNENYKVADVFQDSLPKADIINVPFLVNYLATKEELVKFLSKVKASLNEGGLAAFIIDLPTSKDLRVYGATKKVLGETKDGAPMVITLYDESGVTICELKAYYISAKTFEDCLVRAGFTTCNQVSPIVSEAGLSKFGGEYWKEYFEDTQLGYYFCS